MGHLHQSQGLLAAVLMHLDLHYGHMIAGNCCRRSQDHEEARDGHHLHHSSAATQNQYLLREVSAPTLTTASTFSSIALLAALIASLEPTSPISRSTSPGPEL